MAVIRTNPLPVGVYWQDIFPGKDEPAWSAWLTKNKGKVLVRKTTAHENPPSPGEPRGSWVLFEVKEPVTWEGPGFPTVAPAGVATTPKDVVQAPEHQPDLIDQLGSIKDPLGAVRNIALLAGVGVLALVFLSLKRK